MHHLPHVPKVSFFIRACAYRSLQKGGNISQAQHGIWNVRWNEGQSSGPHNKASSISRQSVSSHIAHGQKITCYNPSLE